MSQRYSLRAAFANWRLLLALISPLFLANIALAILVIARGEFSGWPFYLTVYLIHKFTTDLAVFALVAFVLLRLPRPEIGLLLWIMVGFVVVATDCVIYGYSLTLLEGFHFQLIAWDFIKLYVGPGLIAALVALCVSVIAVWRLLRKVNDGTCGAGLAVLGLSLATLSAINVPHWLYERDLGVSVETIRAQEVSTRLRYVIQNPLGRLVREILRTDDYRIRSDADLRADELGLWRDELSLGEREYPALDVPAFRRVILMMSESISLELLGGYNDQLPVTLTPFYSSPAVEPHMMRNVWTVATPTRQGFTATLTSQPNVRLAVRAGRGLSFVHALAAANFETIFLRADSVYFSPELYLMRDFGFRTILGKEYFEERPEFGDYLRGAGVADYFVYDKMLDLLEEHRDRKLFITMIGSDTHPGARPAYSELPYSKPPEMVHDVEGATELLSSMVWHDEDMKRFFEGLVARGLWNEDTLLVVTTDHCRPYGPELRNVPGYLADALCRIPLAFLSPAELPKVDVMRLGSQLDTAPSILHLLGLSVPSGYWGDSAFSRRHASTVLGSFRNQIFVRSAGGTRSFDPDAPASPADERLRDLYNTLYLPGR